LIAFIDYLSAPSPPAHYKTHAQLRAAYCEGDLVFFVRQPWPRAIPRLTQRRGDRLAALASADYNCVSRRFTRSSNATSGARRGRHPRARLPAQAVRPFHASLRGGPARSSAYEAGARSRLDHCAAVARGDRHADVLRSTAGASRGASGADVPHGHRRYSARAARSVRLRVPREKSALLAASSPMRRRRIAEDPPRRAGGVHATRTRSRRSSTIAPPRAAPETRAPLHESCFFNRFIAPYCPTLLRRLPTYERSSHPGKLRMVYKCAPAPEMHSAATSPRAGGCVRRAVKFLACFNDRFVLPNTSARARRPEPPTRSNLGLDLDRCRQGSGRSAQSAGAVGADGDSTATRSAHRHADVVSSTGRSSPARGPIDGARRRGQRRSADARLITSPL